MIRIAEFIRACQVPYKYLLSALFYRFIVCFPHSINAPITLCLSPVPAPFFLTFSPCPFLLSSSDCHRISTEHSPKLQIRSHSYLRAVSEVSINRSLDSLDPAGLLASPKFRSRNESYMRAMSTISQVSGTHGPVPFSPRPPPLPCVIRLCRREGIPSVGSLKSKINNQTDKGTSTQKKHSGDDLKSGTEFDQIPPIGSLKNMDV